MGPWVKCTLRWCGGAVACAVEWMRCGKPLFRMSFSAPTNFARNSAATASKLELRSLELQRFWMLLNVHAVELRATLCSHSARIAAFVLACIRDLGVLDRKLSSG